MRISGSSQYGLCGDCAGNGYSLEKNSLFSNDDPTPTAIPEASVDLPRAYAITAVAPNPFNPGTTVSFDLPKPRDVSVTVFDSARVAGSERSGRRCALRLASTALSGTAATSGA